MTETHERWVLVTRPEGQADELERYLTERGARVVCQPTIEIGPPTDAYAALDRALKGLKAFDWCVFSSVNGVRAVCERAAECELTANDFQFCRIAAIGPGTRNALENAGLNVSFTPSVYRAEDLAQGLLPFAEKNERFLLIRASRGREVLAETLRGGGGRVTQVVSYQSRDVTPESDSWNPEILEKMNRGEIAWITISSSAIAAAAVRLFGEALRKTRIASISPITSAALEDLGFSPAFEASEATMAGLAACFERKEIEK